MDHHDRVDRQFGSRAQAHLESAVHARGQDLQHLAQLAATLSDDARALDMGCGAGHASFAMAPHVREVVAYDLSRDMLAVVRDAATERRLSSVRTELGPAEQLPFEAGTFDLVVSRYSAHHWSDPISALREAARVLKPEGRLCFIDVVGPQGPHATLLDTHLQALELLRDTSHVRDYSPTEWRAMLQAAGFELAAEQTWPLEIEFASWVARISTPPVLEAAIRHLLADAPMEVQRYYRIRATLDFTLESAMFTARLA